MCKSNRFVLDLSNHFDSYVSNRIPQSYYCTYKPQTRTKHLQVISTVFHTSHLQKITCTYNHIVIQDTVRDLHGFIQIYNAGDSSTSYITGHIHIKIQRFLVDIHICHCYFQIWRVYDFVIDVLSNSCIYHINFIYHLQDLNFNYDLKQISETIPANMTHDHLKFH